VVAVSLVNAAAEAMQATSQTASTLALLGITKEHSLQHACMRNKTVLYKVGIRIIVGRGFCTRVSSDEVGECYTSRPQQFS